MSDKSKDLMSALAIGEGQWFIYREVPERSSAGTKVDELIEVFSAAEDAEDLVAEHARSIGGTSWEYDDSEGY